MKKNDLNFKGILEVNNNKKNPNHPDFFGKINIHNVDYTLAAWNKVSKNTNTEYISISVKNSDDNTYSYGVLFINNHKVDKQPDRQGNIKINDVEYFLAAWNNENSINLIANVKENKISENTEQKELNNEKEDSLPPESISSKEVIKDTTETNIDEDWNIDDNI